MFGHIPPFVRRGQSKIEKSSAARWFPKPATSKGNTAATSSSEARSRMSSLRRRWLSAMTGGVPLVSFTHWLPWTIEVKKTLPGSQCPERSHGICGCCETAVGATRSVYTIPPRSSRSSFGARQRSTKTRQSLHQTETPTVP